MLCAACSKRSFTVLLPATAVAIALLSSGWAGPSGKQPAGKKATPKKKMKASAGGSSHSDETLRDWPSFRGPMASGVAIGCNPPAKWNMSTGENVLWKSPIKGLGHGSPVIWNDRLIVTTAINTQKKDDLKVGLYGNIESVQDESEQEWHVICLDKKTGEVKWDQLAHKGVPKIKRHTKATHANCTPATDGRHVVAFFGSEGLYCYDMEGKLIWKKDLGTLDSGFFAVPEAQWEFGSSPIIHDKLVIVQCDVQGGGFVAAFDVKDGNEVWRTARTDVPTWSTPTAVPGKNILLVNGWHQRAGYDLKSGKELWRMDGGGDIPVPTPVVWNDVAFFSSAHGQWGPIFAIKLDAKGDISMDLSADETSNEHIVWSDPRSYAYMQTPLVLNNRVYNTRDNGVVTCYDAKSGEKVFQRRLGNGSTGFTASAVAAVKGVDKRGDAKGHVYYTSEDGDVFVMTAGQKPRPPKSYALDEVCMATPAISGDVIYFRTQGHVVAIGRK